MNPNTTRVLAVSLALLLAGVLIAPLGAVAERPHASHTDVDETVTTLTTDESFLNRYDSAAGDPETGAPISVGVVGDGAYAGDVADLLADASGGDIEAEPVTGDEAIGSDHDVYVVQRIDDDAVEPFVDATSGGDVGVVYLDQFDEASGDANGVTQFASVSDAVGGVQGDYDPNESVDGPSYVVTSSHPIVAAYGVGDSIPIHTETFSDHAWITDTSFESIADVSVDGETRGIGLAVDEGSSTVLAASSGLNQYANATAQTDEAASVLANAVAHVGNADPEPPEEDVIRLANATAPAGESATVSLDTDIDGIAGYQARIEYDPAVVDFVAAEGVDIADPTVNDEDGTLTLSASQTSGVDAPTLANLTFETVGTAGESTTLAFDTGFTQLNTENEIVQPSAYLDGSIGVADDGGSDCDRPGDVDGDGQVISIDATLTQRYIAGYDPSGFDADCADLTDDGEITAADVTAIHQEIVGVSV
ncbi:dockerin type I domain-containing protein [Halovivax cerinus]|uniref:Dockerin type I domain-containing protein n=2 Tax=Halovivax cerinus TaxID=1487865 RepID=A0ABD5NQ66_9EURY